MLDSQQGEHVHFTVTDIEKLIPHRAPFLLLDTISCIDFENAAIAGRRVIDSADPVFQGHFPGEPIYPGVLQVEMIGQLALCLVSLLEHHTRDPGQVPAPVKVRVSRVHQAVFYNAIAPGDNLTVIAALVNKDELATTVAGQIYHGDQLCVVALLEACFVD